MRRHLRMNIIDVSTTPTIAITAATSDAVIVNTNELFSVDTCSGRDMSVEKGEGAVMRDGTDTESASVEMVNRGEGRGGVREREGMAGRV